MSFFRKKPVVIEARQFNGQRDSADEILAWMGAENGAWWDGVMAIYTLEGGHIASPDDWIIRGVAGEFYPCKPDIFTATYERVRPSLASSQHPSDTREGECASAQKPTRPALNPSEPEGGE